MKANPSKCLRTKDNAFVFISKVNNKSQWDRKWFLCFLFA